MGDDDSMSYDHNESPPSQHEKWQIAWQRPSGEFTSNASRVFTKKIVGISFC